MQVYELDQQDGNLEEPQRQPSRVWEMFQWGLYVTLGVQVGLVIPWIIILVLFFGVSFNRF